MEYLLCFFAGIGIGAVTMVMLITGTTIDRYAAADEGEQQPASME